MFSQRLSVCSSVRPSTTIPVSEVLTPSNMAVALNLCFLCYLGLPSQSSSVRKKTCQAPNTATLQHDSSIRTSRALFVGSLRIELTEKLYSKVAIFTAVQQGGIKQIR